MKAKNITTSPTRGLMVLALMMFVLVAPMSARGTITDDDIKNLGRESAEGAPKLAEPVSAGKIAMRLTFSLGVVIGLIALAAYAAKRYLPARVAAGRGGAIDVMATRGIGGGKSLLLVRVKDKTVLLGVSAQSVQFLTDVEHERGAWEEAAVQAGLHDAALETGERL